MPSANLIICTPGRADREVELSGGASLGRASDNSVCIDDSGVSRYHAIIEIRGGAFWLTDLGSVNGTTLNGEAITGEQQLFDHDRISLGGPTTIEFRSADARRAPAGDGEGRSVDVTPHSPQNQPPSGGGLSRRTVVIGVIAGLAVLAVAALLLSGVFTRSSALRIRIASPQTGTTIQGPFNVRIQVDSPAKVSRIVFRLDGTEFANAMHPPFDLSVDPNQLVTRFPALRTGSHVLSVVAEDRDGKRMEPEGVLLAFDIRPSVAESDGDAPGGDSDGGPISTGPGLVDIAALSQSLASQFSGKSGYVFAPQFVEQIRIRANDYRVDVIDDATRHRRDICRAFSNQGLPPLLGFVLAMSQSRFKETPGGQSGAGLWRVPPSIASAQGYLAPGESESVLADSKRSAEIAAAYVKYLDGLFGREDFMYAIACFGMPVNQAGEVRTRLEQQDASSHRDFWRMVELGVVPRDAADRVVKFFAAGIVGENPQSFGLRPERLSSLC